MNLVKSLLFSALSAPLTTFAFEFNLSYTIGGNSEFNASSKGVLIVDLNNDGFNPNTIAFSDLTAGNFIGTDNLIFSTSGNGAAIAEDQFVLTSPNVKYNTDAYGSVIESLWTSGKPIYLLWTNGTHSSGQEFFYYRNDDPGNAGGDIGFITPSVGATSNITDVSTNLGGDTISYIINEQNGFLNSGGIAILNSKNLTRLPNSQFTFLIQTDVPTYGRVEKSNDLLNWTTVIETLLISGNNSLTFTDEDSSNQKKLFIRFSE